MLNHTNHLTESDRVTPAVASNVIFATAPITVRLTRLDGRSFTYRLTRMVPKETHVTLAGVRVTKDGKRIVGNGGASFICDVFRSTGIYGGAGRIEVL